MYWKCGGNSIDGSQMFTLIPENLMNALPSIDPNYSFYDGHIKVL